MSKSHVRFQMFGVKNVATGAKTRAFYSLDNRCDGRKCITVYDRDYGHQLAKVFDGSGVKYTNDTDMMTDYFDKGHVDIFETDEIYADARAQVEAVLAKAKAKREAPKVAPVLAPIVVKKVDEQKVPSGGKRFCVELECGKVAILVTVARTYLWVLVQSAATARRSLGKTYVSAEVAIGWYKSPAIKAMIKTAVTIANEPASVLAAITEAAAVPKGWDKLEGGPEGTSLEAAYVVQE